MLIGALNANNHNGAAYLVLGGSNLTSSPLSSAIVYSGPEESALAGVSVAIGDVNGDGYGDMLIGANFVNNQSGVAYLVLGSSNPSNTALANAITFSGSGQENAGRAVAIGDINGDGYGDMLIGAIAANSYNGAAYLVLGDNNLSNSNLSSAIVYNGAGGEQAGISVAIGDVNGDDYGDMLIGAWSGNDAAYLVLGSSHPTNSPLSDAIAYSGIGGEQAGESVTIGDVNGDGYGDMLIGAPNYNNGNGAAYLVFGSSNLVSNVLSNAIAFNGLTKTQTGHAVSVGDVNGDGIGDMLIGAPNINQSYVILGNKTPWLSSSSSSSNYVVDMPYLVLNPALQIHENATKIIGATVQITDNYQEDEDLLKIIGLPENINLQSYNSSTGTLTLTGLANVSEYQAVLERVAYVNTADNPNIQPRTISFQVNDGRLCGISNQFNQTITILPATPSIPCPPFDNLNGLGSSTLVNAGFQLFNSSAGSYGQAVSVGDVNGDSYEDILIGANYANQTYLVLGSVSPNNVNLGTEAFLLDNGTGGTGISVAIGDVNGDGLKDMLIGTGINQAYLVLGSKNPKDVNLETEGILLYNGSGNAGLSLAIGDVNGDGYGDMVLGALGINSTFLVLGSKNPINVNLETGAIMLSGGAGGAGSVVVSGDVNGDGYKDILIGAYRENTVYLVLGSANPTAVNLTSAITFSGGNGNAGLSLAIGDVNGDGYGDIVIGAPDAEQAYLILGSSNINGVNLTEKALILNGGSGRAAYSLAVGDVNGDGYGDILLGTFHNVNQLYLVFGSISPSNINLTESAILLSGGIGDTGPIVAIGDINGDGLSDMLLGTVNANLTYAVLGNRTPWLSSNSTNATYTADSGDILLNPNLQLHENEAPIIGVTIQITEGYQPSEDILNAPQLPSGISASFNTTSGALTLSGIASAADYQIALENIAYANTADYPSSVARTITFQADDGRLCGISNSFKQTLNINAGKPTASPTGLPSSGSSSGSNSSGLSHGMLALFIGLPVGLFILLLIGLGAYYQKKRSSESRYSFFNARRLEAIPEGGEEMPLFQEKNQEKRLF
jgi:hypothetical protein